ncbi:MAG: M1 family metallopeptidase [Saprospiraceae bacterium]|nr:M1 family metallopeptidase [Saprospiraceae bacterium]
MRYSFIFFCFLSFLGLANAQESYFQQQVNYKIEVTLDDEAHLLKGNIDITYINHAPEALDTIWMHLWGNAYLNQSTAFAKQQVNQGIQAFYFAKAEQKGGYTGLDFHINQQAIDWHFHPQHPDIAYLLPKQPLAPGDSMHISTPFTLKIPAPFSRLGHVGRAYQITQWYPKPAVYDAQGWHPMPYLDIGEFYSEFGHFDVSLTLDADYVVAATGTLQTESEQAWLESLARKEPIKKDSSQQKTIRFTAEQVHDFAWFANPDFEVDRSDVPLPSGKKVATWAFYLPKQNSNWSKATDYLNRAILFYSEKVGEYPYPHATAVQGPLEAGDGMEYPMITILSVQSDPKLLDIVITHEIGHNWFYGILASNERDHPWMDEGLNSYYEERYTQLYYPNGLELLPEEFTKDTEFKGNALIYYLQANRHLDTAPDDFSPDISDINYLLGAYAKPALAFQYLEAYLGTSRMDSLMQTYYQEWKFKHPQPSDLRQHLEAGSATSLDWLFDGLLYSNKQLDYAIIGAKKERGWMLRIQNEGKIAGPFEIAAIRKGKVVKSKWYEGFQKDTTIRFGRGNFETFVIDPDYKTLDIDRRNNQIKTSGISKASTPLQFKFLLGLGNEKKNTIYYTPTIGFNSYDRTMAGLAVYNTFLPARPVEWSFNPMYSFETGDVLGLANLNFYAHPSGGIVERVKAGLGIKSFNYQSIETDDFDYDLQYLRITPSVQLDFRPKEGQAFRQKLNWRTLLLRTEQANFEQTPDGTDVNFDWSSNFIHELHYTGSNTQSIHPFRMDVRLEYQDYTDAFDENQYYLKGSVELKYAYTFQRKKRFHIRAFAGAFLLNSLTNDTQPRGLFFGSYNLVSSGYNDYRYDNFYIGRNETNWLASQQVSIQEGGLKLPINSPNRNIQGSNDYILALNLKSDLPFGFPASIPIKAYFDIGYYHDITPFGRGKTFSDQLLWSGGLMIDLFDEVLGIYFPIVNSDNLELEALLAERGSYWNRITFSLDLQRLNPWKFLRTANP